MDVASKAGLDTSALKQALDVEKYLPILQETTSEAHQLGFSGVPAFVVGGKYSIVGVQPIEVFRDAIRKL